MSKKPNLKFWQIWNVSFGFLGVQFGFALQNANVSRILNDLGADLHSLSLFWLAAPITGLIIQPIVGGASDRTWNKLGRRGPFIFGGAIFAALGMILMPNSSLFIKLMPPMLFGGIMFALMDGSFNVTMQPFRALVADMVPTAQRNIGYSIQSFLINVGAVLGSILPFFLTNIIGLENVAEAGKVAPTVLWAFYIGATVLLGSVLWTVFSTKEYPPEQFNAFKEDASTESEAEEITTGKLSIKARLKSFISLFTEMPKTMKQLAIVQFFSWFALYIMWVYTTPAVGQTLWGIAPDFYNMEKELIPDTIKEHMGSAGDWVGILFAAYSLFAALFSIILGRLANAFGKKIIYGLSLVLGGIGFISMLLFDAGETVKVNLLITSAFVPKGAVMWLISMIGIGIAWAAILAMPYSILSSSLPKKRMGIYMGIFNFTVAGPQIIAGLFSGVIVKNLFGGNALSILIVAGIAMIIGGLSVVWVYDPESKKQGN